MNFKSGDQITYNSAAGVQTASIRAIRNSPNGKGVSIPWLFITVAPTAKTPFPSYLSLPADEASLKMYEVQLA